MKKYWRGLILIFLFVLALRLFFAFQTPFYSSDAAYLHLRYVETITEGKLLFNDPLGYGGRMLITSPLFEAILAFFSLFMPMSLVLKLLPNVFASLLVFPVFLISHRLTKHEHISYFTALLASLVPAFVTHTFNHITPLTLAIPLFFFLIYLWIRIPERKLVLPFLGALLLLIFIHPISIILVLVIGLYIILALVENIKVSLAERELGIFALFFALWAQFLIYKKLILFHGPSVLWQNIPEPLITNFYASVTIIGAIIQIGAYPLVEGTYALYRTAFKKPNKQTHVLLSITIFVGVLLWFKLIDLSTGFMLLGITLSILFAQSLILLVDFVKETKFKKYNWIFITVSLILAIGSTAYPAYAAVQTQLDNTITQEEVSALSLLSSRLPENATILAPPDYGNYVTALAKRKNVIDTHYFLQSRIDERYKDVTRAYHTLFETEAVELFDKYDATHLIVPPGTKDIKYGDNKCFKRIHSTNIRIYEKNPECVVHVV